MKSTILLPLLALGTAAAADDRPPHRFLIGLSPSFGFIEHAEIDSGGLLEFVPAAGLGLAWQGGLRPGLGWKLSAHADIGPSIIFSSWEEEGDSSATPGPDAAVRAFHAGLQAVLGSRRFKLEPGIGLTVGNHSEDSLWVGLYGNHPRDPDDPFLLVDGILGASLAFGEREQFVFSGSVTLGGWAGRTMGRARCGFYYAFEPDRKSVV